MADFSDVYCHSCRKAHPREDMRLIVSNGRKKWRCIHSIRNAASATKTEREAFGRQAREQNKARSRAKLDNMMAARPPLADD
jgi:hypothetical protein